MTENDIPASGETNPQSVIDDKRKDTEVNIETGDNPPGGISSIQGDELMPDEYYDMRDEITQEKVITDLNMPLWRRYFHNLKELMRIDDKKVQLEFDPDEFESDKRWAAYYEMKNRRFGGYPNYHRRRIAENIPYWKELIDVIRSKPGCRTLELGFGAGTSMIELGVQRNNLNIDMIAGLDLEINTAALAITNNLSLARSIFRDLPARLNPFFIARGNYMNTQLKKESYDLAYNYGVYEHWPADDVVENIKASLGFLKEDGTLVFVVPLPAAHDPLQRKRIAELPVRAETKGNFGDERQYTKENWEEFIDKAGGVIEKKLGYWVPEFGSSLRHPIDPEKYYGKGMLAIYVVKKAPKGSDDDSISFAAVGANNSVTSILV
jgi:SAM-dependent methyltransferase